MSGREEILQRVASAADHLVPHPGDYPSPGGPGGWDEFAESLRRVGGEPYGPLARSELRERLVAWVRAWAGERRVVATPQAAQLADGLPWPSVPAEVDPHQLSDVEVAILCGAHGVAENGAVALPGSEAAPRALPFLCQRLVLVLAADRIVPDMHAALGRIAPEDLASHHYTWVSGPSKTADIEQTLVLGAHGPKAVAVVGVRVERA